MFPRLWGAQAWALQHPQDSVKLGCPARQPRKWQACCPLCFVWHCYPNKFWSICCCPLVLMDFITTQNTWQNLHPWYLNISIVLSAELLKVGPSRALTASLLTGCDRSPSALGWGWALPSGARMYRATELHCAQCPGCWDPGLTPCFQILHSDPESTPPCLCLHT